MPDTCTEYDFKKIIEFCKFFFQFKVVLINQGFLVYKFAETSADKKFVCDLQVQCSNDKPENKLYNNWPSMLVL